MNNQTPPSPGNHALDRSSDRYSDLIEEVNSMVLRMDRNGVVIYANRYTCDFFGFKKEELVGRCVLDTIVPRKEGSGRNLMEHIRDICENPERHANDENENCKKDGSRVWVSWTNKAIRNSHENVLEILCIGNDITARKRAEERLQQERQMLRRLLESQHHELQMVGYEIHDGLAQLLAAAGIHLQMFEHFREEKPKEAEKALKNARDTLDQALAETRRLVGGLRPAVIEEAGLAVAVKLLVAEREEQSGINMELICDEPFQRLNSLAENALYRIVQESLTNAVRYSKSKNIRIALHQSGGRVTLEIRDWGCGFETQAVGKSHFGLEGIRERASILGGSAKIESQPGRGTTICVELPMISPDD